MVRVNYEFKVICLSTKKGEVEDDVRSYYINNGFCVYKTKWIQNYYWHKMLGFPTNIWDDEEGKEIIELEKLIKKKGLWKEWRKLWWNAGNGYYMFFLPKGFPDLIVFNKERFFFCEVKSEKDSHRMEQINWMTKYPAFHYELVWVKPITLDAEYFILKMEKDRKNIALPLEKRFNEHSLRLTEI